MNAKVTESADGETITIVDMVGDVSVIGRCRNGNGATLEIRCAGGTASIEIAQFDLDKLSSWLLTCGMPAEYQAGSGAGAGLRGRSRGCLSIVGGNESR